MVRTQFRHYAIGVIAVLSAACGPPAPGALQITPTEIALGLGQETTVRAVDGDGATPPHVAWKSRNPGIAEIVVEQDTVRILARSPGKTCIHASFLLEAAATCVTVVDAAAVPAGHVRWAVEKSAVLPSAQIDDVIPARRDETPLTVALFVVEIDYGIRKWDGLQRVTVRGLEADGRERWRSYIDRVAYQKGVPDLQGGLILVHGGPGDRTSSVRRFDGISGVESWRYDSPGGLPLAPAIRPDGTVFLVEEIDDPKSGGIAAVDLIGLDGATGKETSRLPLPLTERIYPEKTSIVAPMLSPLVIEDDGTVALAAGTELQNSISKRNGAELKLLRVSPGGNAAWQTIREHEREGDWTSYRPRVVTPNGEGALQVTWFERDPGLGHALATRTRVLPWEQDVVISAIDGLGNGYGVMGWGVNGFGEDTKLEVVRFDVTTGSPLGAVIAAGPRMRALSGRPDGGVVVRDGAGDVRHYDVDGTLLKTVKTPSNGQHPWRLVIAGEDFIETDGGTVVAFRVGDH